MYIDEKTAQLILDAIAWCNDDWVTNLEEEWTDSMKVVVARADFLLFCKDRGIEGVEKEIGNK